MVLIIEKTLPIHFLVPGQPNTGDGNTGITNMYLIIGLWLAMALLLFLFRPRTLQNTNDTSGKPNNRVKANISYNFNF